MLLAAPLTMKLVCRLTSSGAIAGLLMKLGGIAVWQQLRVFLPGACCSPSRERPFEQPYVMQAKGRVHECTSMSQQGRPYKCLSA